MNVISGRAPHMGGERGVTRAHALPRSCKNIEGSEISDGDSESDLEVARPRTCKKPVSYAEKVSSASPVCSSPPTVSSPTPPRLHFRRGAATHSRPIFQRSESVDLETSEDQRQASSSPTANKGFRKAIEVGSSTSPLRGASSSSHCRVRTPIKDRRRIDASKKPKKAKEIIVINSSPISLMGKNRRAKSFEKASPGKKKKSAAAAGRHFKGTSARA